LSERWRDASPEDIACMSGFSSADAMNRYIKKSTGLTACAMREQIFGT
jgi:AraC-like DNA-binding protein